MRNALLGAAETALLRSISLQCLVQFGFLVAAKLTTLVEVSCPFLLSSFLPFVPKWAKTVQTSIAAYVVYAINFKSEVIHDLSEAVWRPQCPQNLIFSLSVSD